MTFLQSTIFPLSACYYGSVLSGISGGLSDRPPDMPDMPHLKVLN